MSPIWAQVYQGGAVRDTDASTVHPTISRRRFRHAPPANISEIEEIQENINGGDEESEELTGPFSGGACDISILHSF